MEHRTETRLRPLSQAQILLCCAALVLITSLLRFPGVGEGLPYFQREDEAHHYNRIIRMMQSGDLNPHYFHKPSLHFYLRLPVAAASFLWTVKQGQARHVQDVQTKDPSGIAGYAFTASHPGMVKWNRLLSLVFCVGMILLAAAMTYQLTGNLLAAACTGLLSGFSPPLIQEAAVIGVDMPMAFFCCLSVFLARRYLASGGNEQPNTSLLLWSAFCAGLALSTKYNALPIVLVPLSAPLLFWPLRMFDVLKVIMLVMGGFLLGSPYIPFSMPLFLDQFAYEIWHYGIAGHEGHMAEPGLPQALFYLSWLARDAVGKLALLAMASGFFWLFKKRPRETLVTALFPILFFGLMSAQKANFTRNVLVLIPFISIFAGATVAQLYALLHRSPARTPLCYAAALMVLLQPAIAGIPVTLHSALMPPDTRTQAYQWLHHHQLSSEVVVAGSLWLPQFTVYQEGERKLSRPGLTRLHGKLESAADLYNKGFDTLVVGPRAQQTLSDLSRVSIPLHSFEGTTDISRIPQNPAIEVRQLQEELALPLLTPAVSAVLRKEGIQCATDKSPPRFITGVEGHCWIQHRHSVLQIGSFNAETINLELMSPWANQTVHFSAGEWSQEVHLQHPGAFEKVALRMPSGTKEISLTVPLVKSPHAHGLSEDTRRLGVALRVTSHEGE